MPEENPDVLRRFVPMKSRKAGQVALHERFHRRQIEAADEHEGEVARIGKALLVERERSVEVHLVHVGGLHWPRSKMILRQRRAERIFECRVGQRVLVRQRHLQLFLEDAERHGVGARRREREIDELEHRFEVFA